MANTVSQLSYANTFGDWVVTTNNLLKENNDLAANNYVKSTGTLYLNAPTLGLQVANNAIVAGQLRVQGTGSSAYVQNGLRVDGILTANSATFSNPITANTITVANNVTINGNLIIGSSTISSSGGQLNVNISGNANTVNNGVYTTGSYSNPSWITAIANTKITGVINTTQIANTGVSAGVYTSPTITVDETGRISVAANGVPGGVFSITGNTNQIIANTSTGDIQLTLPQNVDVDANVQFNSLGVGVAANNNTGEILAANNITSYYSDDRLKTRIENIPSALEKVQSLNGFYYRANETAQKLGYSDKLEVGLSAQEVQKVLPEIIAAAPIDSQYMTIHYERVIPLLVEAIKELSAEVEKLKK